MPENKNLDAFLSRIDESGFSVGSELKQKILRKTYRKIRSRWFNMRAVAAACLILAVLSAFIPNTPVNALYKKIFSFIPGVGVVQSTNESNRITGILEKPVRLSDGEEFVEIRSAWLSGNELHVSVKTNVGAIDAGEFKDPAEFKKFFAGETAPAFYLVRSEGRTKSGHTVYAGPSYETRVYSMDASFYLADGDIGRQSFGFELEGFGKQVEITMSSVASGELPEDMGNAAVIDDIAVFANIERQGDVVEVLLSSSAPPDFKNIRFQLFDIEKPVFKTGAYITDKDGNIYAPDEELAKKNDGSFNTLYFNIPGDKEGLRLIIPQILYSRAYRGNDIKIRMPKAGTIQKVNKTADINGTSLLLESTSLVSANDPILPVEFSDSACLRIDTSAKTVNAREMVLRVLPDIEVPDGLSYAPISQAVYSEIWNNGKSGYSFISLEKIESIQKIMVNFNVEYAMIGPWEMEIEP